MQIWKLKTRIRKLKNADSGTKTADSETKNADSETTARELGNYCVLGVLNWNWQLARFPLRRGFPSGDRRLLEHERNYGLGMDALVTVGTRTELWFGHGCSGDCMLLEHERNYGLGMHALVTVGSWMLVEHERNYGLGMDALVTACSWNTNGIMVWA